MARRRTTLAEVAEAAGVSIATVSKVLNQREDVALDTRRKVQRHLREAEYRPTVSDTVLRRGRTQLEVSADTPANAYTMTLLDGMITAATDFGAELVLGPHRSTEDSTPDRLLKSGRAGAIFITADASSPLITGLLEADFPVVVIDPMHASVGSAVSVGATNFTGGLVATQHLIELGHRRIAHAGGLLDVACSQARLAGYSSALRQAGIDQDESLITHSRFHYEAGRESAQKLLDRDDPPTAIFAGNDEIALGVMEEARRRSLRIPDDLSVVGFDDTFMATRSAPQLTTITQPLAEMGRAAVTALMQMINNEPVVAHHVELATRLTLRDSTCPPSLANARTPRIP